METGALVFTVLGTVILLPLFASRATFLAGTRLGCLFYYANVGFDLVTKRTPLGRGLVEAVMLAIGLGGLVFAGVASSMIGGIAAAYLTLRLLLACQESAALTAAYTRPDGRRKQVGKRPPQALCGAIPDPGFHPDLVINLAGPFVERYPRYSLGDLAVGRAFEIQLITANHSLIPCQVNADVTIETGDGLEGLQRPAFSIPALSSGTAHRASLLFRAINESGAGDLKIAVRIAGRVYRLAVHYRSVFDPSRVRACDARVSRFPGARRSGFAWRGDMDHYDETTFQSIEGLSQTLSLAARYRFPQTMFLSTRLTLDRQETKAYYDHFQVERGQSHLPDFASWLKTNAELVHIAEYPFVSTKPFLLELGNHMHLHYGTDAAAAVENDWALEAGIRQGEYEWTPAGADSLTEQRDNALKARRMMEDYLDFSPKSWAMPDSTNDRSTPAAVEAAGCEVTSDADAAHRHNVLLQPPPHHPQGTTAVELTKRYPGDPQDYIHYAMFLYWLHRGHRLGIPVVFMCHQHMRLYEGHACTRFTEAVLRYVLTRFNGDFHINTVYGIGSYWRNVLSPQTRSVHVEKDETGVNVTNGGRNKLSDVPVDVEYSNGRTATFLLDLPAYTTVSFDSQGRILSTSACPRESETRRSDV